MLDDDKGMAKLSRHFVRKAMSEYEPPVLINLLLDEDPIVRTCAGFQLHLTGGSMDDFERIADLARNNAGDVREVSAYVLGQFGTPNYPYRDQSIPVLMQLIHDPENEVRVAAIDALTHLNGAEAKANVLEAVHDTSSAVRRAVATYISVLARSTETVQALETLTADIDEDVREAALLSREDLQI